MNGAKDTLLKHGIVKSTIGCFTLDSGGMLQLGRKMRKRIPISESAVEEDRLSRRSALTRLAQLAAAAGAIGSIGLAPRMAYASGCVAYYQGQRPNVNFDGSPG